MRTLLGILLATCACTTGPLNGATAPGSVVGQTFSFNGYYYQPSTTIHLQVLNDPTLDPGPAGNWSEFATAVTSVTPQNFNNPTYPLYFWTVTAAPRPGGLQPLAVTKRWPQGGLVRVRALVTDGTSSYVLKTFDDVTFGKCIADNLNVDWEIVGKRCAGLGEDTEALVSTSNIAAPPGSKGNFQALGFLGRKGWFSEAETDEYYAQIQAPQSLFDFYYHFGFDHGEVTATYYNDAELGLGREMHCRDLGGGLACFVVQYSGDPGKRDPTTGFVAPSFNVDPAVVLADAVGPKLSAFETVAMIFAPLASNPVRFIVYGPDGNRARRAVFDTTENNTSIPSNCLACHGISSFYDPSTNEVKQGAQFLPFDPFSYKYANVPGFTFADQADKFRQLNALIKKYTTAPAITQLIDGMYAPKPVTDPTAVANDDYVPSAWLSWPGARHPLDGKALYRGAVKVACRTCHVSETTRPDLDFLEPTDFTMPLDPLNSPRALACGNPHYMPHAERAMKKFWESGARAYLVTGLAASGYPDLAGACKP
jgi:hypothetical protein